jgi:zinc transporter 1
MQDTQRHIDHRHKVTASNLGGHDLGMMGVLIHVMGDAVNNVGVIIAALVIWLAEYDGRFYADPGVSMGIALLILLSALPLGELHLVLVDYPKLITWRYSQK